jgi:hypothetical protein
VSVSATCSKEGEIIMITRRQLLKVAGALGIMPRIPQPQAPGERVLTLVLLDERGQVIPAEIFPPTALSFTNSLRPDGLRWWHTYVVPVTITLNISGCLIDGRWRVWQPFDKPLYFQAGDTFTYSITVNMPGADELAGVFTTESWLKLMAATCPEEWTDLEVTT